MAAALVLVLAIAAACPAGQWLSAQLPQGGPPFEPVALFWFRVARNPVIYRSVIDVPEGIDRATVAVRSAGYLYICIDGRQVYAWGPDKDTAERPRITGDPARVHRVDLSERLTPGRHVLTVSAPAWGPGPAGTSGAGGFVLDGGLYAGPKRAWPLVSDESWSAAAFRPTEIVEDSPVMRLDYDGKARPGVCTASLKVRAVGEAWSAGQDELASAHFQARLSRMRRDADDAAWLLGLLGEKGIYVVDGSAFGWGGPARPAIAPLADKARQLLAGAGKLRGRIDGLAEARADTAERLAEKSPDLAKLDKEAAALSLAAMDLCSQARAADAKTAARLGALRADLLAASGWQDTDHPLSPLNQSRHDRLGWLPLPELADSNLADWGVQVKPGDAQGPPVVMATPLSPCVVLTPGGGELDFHHAAEAKLLLPGGQWADGYDAEKDGRLKANWVLLWLAPAAAGGPQRPILLVFEKQPATIDCAAGVTKLKLGWRSRVIAVRPWAKAVPKKDDAAGIAKMTALWSRAALAVPVDYLSVTKVLEKARPWRDISIDNIPPGPLLGQRVIYDYLVTKDQWGTEPLKLAPLPALCSLALDCKYPTLELDDPAAVQVVQDGGLAGCCRAVAGAGSIGYKYRVEPWPRLVGFTSWMFGQADTGVPGNKREMEIIAAAGVNSYRPQHNFADEPAVGFAPGEKRTRVQVMADCCRDAGVSYVNNIDQTLGPHQKLIRDDYDKWVRTILLPHYDKLLGQLAQREFRQVAYDLVNEPADHQAGKYNPAMSLLTSRIRQVDRRHLLYVEPCQGWGAIEQLKLIEPTGDGLTMYSFHDYSFRMKTARDRWPSAEADISSICRKWWPAFEFALRHGVGIHCGEFGGFHEPTDDSLCQTTLLSDFFRIFDQFGMHHHYYTGRGIYQRQLDGSLRPSNVVRAYRQYTRRKDLNLYYGSR
jgi:alkylhydroperoxidase family enzyme